MLPGSAMRLCMALALNMAAKRTMGVGHPCSYGLFIITFQSTLPGRDPAHPVRPYRAPDGRAGRHWRVGHGIAEVDVLPAQCPGLFGADAGRQHRAMYACMRVPSVVARSAEACPRLRLLLGRPGGPIGVSTSTATLRPMRSRASACLIIRVSALCPRATAALE
jgi:hypothetical protein